MSGRWIVCDAVKSTPNGMATGSKGDIVFTITSSFMRACSPYSLRLIDSTVDEWAFLRRGIELTRGPRCHMLRLYKLSVDGWIKHQM